MMMRCLKNMISGSVNRLFIPHEEKVRCLIPKHGWLFLMVVLTRFLLRSMKLCQLTHLMLDLTGDETSEEKLRTVKVKDLTEGDVLVFLRGAERHAIRELADANLPQGMRKTARLWQKSLKAYVAENGLSLAELKSQLEQAGCKRHVVTLKMWLESESIIGPREYASGDIDAIVQVTGDTELQANVSECSNAISRVWGEHLRASGIIAKRVLSSINDRITVAVDLTGPLDIGDGLILAKVEYVENENVTVPHSAVNRFREGV